MGEEGNSDNLDNFKTMWGAKVSIDADVDENVLKESIDFLGSKLVDENIDPKLLSEHLVELKAILDTKHGYPWTVLAGKNYGTHVVAEKGTFGFFYIGKFAITVFKVGI